VIELKDEIDLKLTEDEQRVDHISRVKKEPEEGQGNGIFLATRAVHRGAGGQDEAGQRFGDNKHIV
jgi:hypothetical protein